MSGGEGGGIWQQDKQEVGVGTATSTRRLVLARLRQYKGVVVGGGGRSQWALCGRGLLTGIPQRGAAAGEPVAPQPPPPPALPLPPLRARRALSPL